MTDKKTPEPLPEQTDNGLHDGDEFISDEELAQIVAEVGNNG